MNGSLALTALLMGLAGGPHCVAMCGAACAGVGQAAGPRQGRALAGFQLGRLGGYAALGGVAAATVQGIGWLGSHTAALRPVWTMLHVAALLLGLVLLVRARQPLWLDGPARGLWQQVRRMSATRGGPWLLGAMWALLPCGLLYSALLVAALAGDVASGAATMALFALGSGLWLWAGPWLWLRLAATGWQGATGGASRWRGEWGVRLAGAALAASAAWTLLQGTAPGRAFMLWCLG
ncbi:sulfite exporter TauE/SafE family protein [Xenophilus sp. Marseille-Q4582]|uniref:sulfite exporter TauE/SafE family protein n=1 Tax=Xenophilus sp. Marseille-Q4582 TaxID=2866600 RepID=UPI001CE49578|nr:sulfite exporter TauE/SafE family protein [Xenophilus sp. Marseille-Q4582]